jgi:hypothetical protein
MPFQAHDENTPVADGRRNTSALQLGPRKKPCVDLFIANFPCLFTSTLLSCATDPLVHHGRHFGRTVHALCNVNALITNGVLRAVELADRPEETFTAQ